MPLQVRRSFSGACHAKTNVVVLVRRVVVVPVVGVQVVVVVVPRTTAQNTTRTKPKSREPQCNILFFQITSYTLSSKLYIFL